MYVYKLVYTHACIHAHYMHAYIFKILYDIHNKIR